MQRALVAVLAAAAVAVAVGWGRSVPLTTTDVTLTMDDGVALAATLNIPDGTPPPGGWPGVVALHGIGANREQVAAIADALEGAGYAVLAYDARAHGRSGGLFSAAGAREIADLRAVRDWLAARPEVSDAIGAWGISYGGGQVLRALTEGVPFRAAAVAETWTDLYATLLPGNLAKSGAILGFLNSVPGERRAPEVNDVAVDAIAGRNLASVRAFAEQRSSRARLGSIATPVLVLQGRRDFAFGLEQGLMMARGLSRDELYIGAFGHAPSRFPGPDMEEVIRRTSAWFDEHLKGTGPAGDRSPFALAPDPYRTGAIGRYTAAPATRTMRLLSRGTSRIGGTGAFTRGLGRTRTVLETFGQPVVQLQASGTFPHVVAVLKARTPSGQDITVSAGGARVQLGRRPRAISFRLIGQVTTIPRGSRLSLRVGGTSGDLLYIAPGPTASRLAVGRVTVAVPVLRRAVSTP